MDQLVKKNFMNSPLSDFAPGGLAQILGPNKTSMALDCVFEQQKESDFLFWISDEGWLYPPSLRIDLNRLILVKAPHAREVWRTALEAVQTGLFGWVFLRPSQACQASTLRKFQLSAERTQTRVFILPPLKLPHWVFKISVNSDEQSYANPLSQRISGESSVQRSNLSSHTQALSLARE